MSTSSPSKGGIPLSPGGRMLEAYRAAVAQLMRGAAAPADIP
jgi:putative IMPACT (imprinted ancient) family translation regulator